MPHSTWTMTTTRPVRRRCAVRTYVWRIPALVIAEVSYLAATRLGAEVEATFVEALAALDVDAPPPQEWTRIAELIRQYADFPLGATDASVLALAERLGTPMS